MAGPLTGVRVLEFTQVIAGPFAGQCLADFGADVYKIEPPEGESWRLQSQFVPQESKSYQTLNRGKRCVTLRLNHPEAQAIVHKLVKTVDVVLINYRPDVPARFNLDYASLSAIKPDLIYGDLTAFGRQGPWSQRPGYDGVVQAASGLMAGEGNLQKDGSPLTITASAIADYGAGLMLADAVVAALYHREQTGEGQMVECSLFATALNVQGSVIMEHPLADGVSRNPLRERRRQRAREGASYEELIAIRESATRLPGNIFYRAYLTQNGAVAVAAETPAQRQRLKALLDTDLPAADEPGFRPHDAAFQRFYVREIERLDMLFVDRTTETWLDLFMQVDIPCAPVHFPEELSHHEQVMANDLLVNVTHDVTGPQQQVAPLLRFSRCELEPLTASPPLGRDTDAVLREIGYDDAAIQALRTRRGVIN